MEVEGVLIRGAIIYNLPDCKKHVVFLLDEMKIEYSLVHGKHGTEVINFVNLCTT